MPTAAEFEVLLSLKDQLSAQLNSALGNARKEMESFAQQTKSASGAAGGLAGALKSLEGGANSAGGALRGAGQHASSLGGFIKNAAASATGFIAAQVVMNGVSSAFSAGKDAIIGFNDSIDRTRIGLTSMLGSADAANALIKDMVTFARDTPFELSGIQKLAPMLIQVGFAARDVIPTLTAVGDAVSAAGRGQESVDRVVLALTQIAAKGKVAGDELMQLTEAGVAGLPILAAGFGVTTGKMSDMVEKGLVPADKALKILIEGMEKRAPGAMEKMSHTWTGAVSNIHDSLTQLTAGAFKPFFDQLVAGANKFATFLASEKVATWAALVSGALANLSKGLAALFSGDNAGAARFFDNFVSFAQRAAQEVQIAFLHIADALLPALEPIVAWGASLAAAGLQWGANLISSFASGLISAAGSILSSALNEIFNFIASWFPASPAKRGPFSRIYDMGADILNSLFVGMSQADFGALDGVMKSVTDILNTALNNQEFGKEGLIPRLLGSEAAVALAIADMHEFGAISEETLSMLGKYLGADAPLIATLVEQFSQLAELDAQIAELNTQVKEFDKDITSAQRAVNAAEREIRAAERAMSDTQRAIAAVDRQIRDLNQAFEAQRRPIQDALDLLTRYYDKALRGADDVIASINREIDARRRLRQGELDRLDTSSRQNALGVAELDLQDALNAVYERRQRLLDAVNSASQGLAAAQHSLGTLAPNADAFTRQNAQQGVTDAQVRLAQAQQNLVRDGVETARDRLNIDRSRQAVIQATLAVENTRDEQARTAATDARNDLEWTRDQALAPIQQQLEDINLAHTAAVRILEDQKAPLEANLQLQQDAIQALKDAKIPLDDVLELLNDQKQALTDQIAVLDAQKAPIEAAVKLTQTRLEHERAVSDQLKAQLDLLNQMATAGGAGGAGAHGGLGAGGLGGALGPGGLGLKPKPSGTIDRSTSIEDVEAMAREASARVAAMDAQIATLGAKVKAQFLKSVKEGMGEGFSAFTKQDAIFIAAGGIIGGLMGGPMGAAMGVLITAAIDKKIKEHGGFEASIKAAIDFSGMFRMFEQPGESDFDRALQAWVQEQFDKIDWAVIGSAIKDRASAIGGAIVEGVRDGIADKWEEITTWFTDRWDYMVEAVKNFLGSNSPSKVFHDIGEDIVQGGLDGIMGKWDAFVEWVTNAWKAAIDSVKKLLGIGSGGSTVFSDIGNQIMTGLQTGVTETWTTVSKWFTDLPGEIVKAVGDVSETLKAAGIALLTGMWNGMKSVWDGFAGIAGWLFSLATKAVEAAGDMSKALWDKGVSMMTGFWNGLKNVWNDVSAWLGNIGQQAANALDPRNYLPSFVPGSNRKSANDDGSGGPIKHPTGGGGGSGTFVEALQSTGMSMDDWMSWIAQNNPSLMAGYQQYQAWQSGGAGGAGGGSGGPSQNLGPMTPGHSPTGDAIRALEQAIVAAQQSAAQSLKSAVDGCKGNPNGNVSIPLPNVPGGNTGMESIPCWELLGMDPRMLFPGIFAAAPYGTSYPGGPGGYQGPGAYSGPGGTGSGHGGPSGGGGGALPGANGYGNANSEVNWGVMPGQAVFNNYGTLVGPDASGQWIQSQLATLQQRNY